MYIRKKIKFRIFILLVLIFGFIYWRGTSALIKKQNLDCKFHFAYAICSSKSKLVVPGFIEVIKAGIKF